MYGLHIATITASTVTEIIAAVGSTFSAIILGWVALRAQSARQQLEEIRKIAGEFSEKNLDKMFRELHDILDAPTRGYYIAEIVRRCLREVLREYGITRQGRRFDNDD